MKRVACGVLLLGLSACAASGSSHAAGSSPTSVATASSSAATTTAVPHSSGGNPVDGPTFCAFLEQTAPRLKADGSSAGAVADFAIELANWIDAHPGQKPRTAADLDDASSKSCPQTRTGVVASLGADSFGGALG